MTTKESMDELRKAAEAQMRRLAPDDGLAPAKRQRKGAPSQLFPVIWRAAMRRPRFLPAPLQPR